MSDAAWHAIAKVVGTLVGVYLVGGITCAILHMRSRMDKP